MVMAEPVRSAPLVADLGFLLRWDLPSSGRDALLVIAIREEPTERHFDPESITYWRTDHAGHGGPAELDFATRVPLRTDVSWGPIEITDRFGVTNTWVSVGGTLEAERTDLSTIVATFRSPGPILEQGGHSQGYDRLGAAMTAFFARLKAPISAIPGAERRLSAARPIERYAAFLRHDVGRIASSDLVRDAYGPEARLVTAEADRLRRRDPAAWEGGARLLTDLRLATDLRTASPASATG
jgi:hypothetical protein